MGRGGGGGWSARGWGGGGGMQGVSMHACMLEQGRICAFCRICMLACMHEGGGGRLGMRKTCRHAGRVP